MFVSISNHRTHRDITEDLWTPKSSSLQESSVMDAELPFKNRGQLSYKDAWDSNSRTNMMQYNNLPMQRLGLIDPYDPHDTHNP